MTEWRHLEWSRKRSGEWIKEQREIDGKASPGVEPEYVAKKGPLSEIGPLSEVGIE